ncbi:alpha/beta hydrolase [Aspergillus melleus]|uniref:alpha/beta hydrolase n=1 Tax=Aspergillus melleus TaxID=138277 RepID=UPI001E8ED86B|nr:uncharacterized protein LDX57_009208 [Aspergillus melleus]KAH8431546.1 hypothetical protein LDX57_009208 [Aspergillus melleus]
MSHFAPDWAKFIEQLGEPLTFSGTTIEELTNKWENHLAPKFMAICQYPPPDMSVTTEDITLENIRLRIYTPPSVTGTEPVGIFIHGGGWIMGSIEQEDMPCREMCKANHMMIVSIGYRLAPKWKFPTALDDCVQGTLWAISHLSLSKFVLMGGSAGANLAFGVALKLIVAGLEEKIKGVLALVPAVVHPDAVPEDKKAEYTSWWENGDRTINTLTTMQTFVSYYDPDPYDPYFSCLLHPRLKDLNKVYIVECGADTLRDDARLMKQALQEAKVPLVYDAYDGYPHYSWMFPAPVLKRHVEEFNANLTRALDWLNE